MEGAAGGPKHPDVVVSVVNHCTRDLVVAAVDSVKRHPPSRHSYEIAVLDNASDDGSVEALAARHPDVRLIAASERRGFGANHNAVAGATESTYLFVFNPDAEVVAGTLDLLLDYLDEHDEIAAVAPALVAPDGRPQENAWRLPSIPGVLMGAFTLGRYSPSVSNRRTAGSVGWVSSCAMLLRRTSFERIGGFDERYFMYAEDMDLCRRLRDAALDVHYVPAARVVHRGQQATAAHPERRLVEQLRSIRLYRRLHQGAAVRAIVWPSLAVGILAKALLGEVLYRLPPPLRPKADVRRLEPLWAALRLLRDDGSRPGLRELAAEWNAAHRDTAPRSAGL